MAIEMYIATNVVALTLWRPYKLVICLLSTASS